MRCHPPVLGTSPFALLSGTPLQSSAITNCNMEQEQHNEARTKHKQMLSSPSMSGKSQ
jgi:hypothetical protein